MHRFTYDIIKPQVFAVVFTALIPGVIEDSLNFIFLLQVVMGLRVNIVGGVGLVIIKLAKILDVVDIVWDLAASAGYTDFIARGTCSFLLLGARTIF